MRNRRLPAGPLLLASFLSILVLVAGCGSGIAVDPGSDSESGSGGLDGAWTLTEATIDGAPLVPADGHPITLQIDGDRIGGNAGCNGFGGTFTADGTDLGLVDVAITEMACAEPQAMDIESTFIQGFWRATTIERSGDTLHLSGDGVSLTYAVVAPVSPTPLVGTVWTLDTFIDGEAASSTMGGADEAMLTLNDDGSFVAPTGCRDLEGTYEAVDDRLSLLFGVDDFACEGPSGQQDAAILRVLEQQDLQLSVDENRLTLTAQDGNGLSFRAVG